MMVDALLFNLFWFASSLRFACAAVFLTLSSHLVPKTLSKYSLPREESYLIQADKYNAESPVICRYKHVRDHGSVTVTV